jgi:hypothetical protein
MPRLWVAFPPNSLPVVWARLAQHRFRVLIDTGAARSLIAPAVASSLGLCLVGTERIIGVTGTAATVPLVEIIGVGVGQIELPPFPAGILDVRFISSLPVMQGNVYKAWVDSKPVQMVRAGD